MVFQILDDKKDCLGYYVDEKFIYEKNPKNITHTWNYSDHLRDKHIYYGHLWVGGRGIKEVCPEHLKTRLELHENIIKAHYKSFINPWSTKCHLVRLRYPWQTWNPPSWNPIL